MVFIWREVCVTLPFLVHVVTGRRSMALVKKIRLKNLDEFI